MPHSSSTHTRRSRTPSRSRQGHFVVVPEAQQVLTNPFPEPKTHKVTVDLQSGRGVGIVMSDRFVPGTNSTNSFPRHVEITKLGPNNIFQGTSVHLGQQILAVQGESITTAFQSASRMKKAIKAYKERRGQGQSHLLSVLTCEPVLAPFCTLFAVNLDESSPGINFDSACSRSLVKVSYLYRKRASPFRGRIKPGDIILAINGQPVSTPEAAYQLLFQARQQGNFLTTIYAVDMSELCQSITQQVQADHLVPQNRTSIAEERVWRDLKLVSNNKDELMNKSSHKESNAATKDMVSLMCENANHHKTLVSTLVFDKESLLLQDAHVPTAFLAVHKNNSASRSALGLDARYFSVVVPFVQKFNGFLQETLDELIESVGCAIWQRGHGGTLASSLPVGRSSSVPRPSAPMEMEVDDEDIPTVEAAIIVSDVSL
mmetsp:Transcript_12853/g.28251  ORF Transcript_12853/g.28251 Transcript_12853/m.28251 type:complete len:430 (-) Transcript_12853:126-1415(-)